MVINTLGAPSTERQKYRLWKKGAILAPLAANMGPQLSQAGRAM